MRLVAGVAVATIVATIAACGRLGFDAGDAPVTDADPAGPAVDADLEGPTWGEHVEGAVDNVGLSSISTDEPIGGGQPDDLYLAVISVKPSRAVDSVAGLGLTWTAVREQCGARDTARLAMFSAQGAAPPGTVTATLNGGVTFMGSAVIAVHRITGASLAAPVANTSTVNTIGGNAEALCTGGVDRDNYSWSTHDTTGPDALVISAVHTARYSHQPGAGWAELADRQAGNLDGSAGLAVIGRTYAQMETDILIDGTFSGPPDWAAIAASIRR